MHVRDLYARHEQTQKIALMFHDVAASHVSQYSGLKFAARFGQSSLFTFGANVEQLSVDVGWALAS
jgi:hypothetical protein